MLPFCASLRPAQTQDRLCDTQLEDCRAPLLTMIDTEQQGTRRGVLVHGRCGVLKQDCRERFQVDDLPVRILMDDRADDSKPTNTPIVKQLKDAGIPMRKKNGGGILHWKMMLFHGQNIAVFSKANFATEQYDTCELGVNWDDEAVFFTRDDQSDEHVPARSSTTCGPTRRAMQLREHHQLRSCEDIRPLLPLDPSLNLQCRAGVRGLAR